MRSTTLALLLLSCVFPVFASHHSANPCKAYFIAVECDEETVNLKMVGLNKAQENWYRKEGNEKDYAGVCLADVPDSVGTQSPWESFVASTANGAYFTNTVKDAPLYLISWEEHTIFIPDTKGGHTAYSANGIISLFDLRDDGKLVTVAPVHATNRTIFSSSSTSLLKAAIKQIKAKQRD
jgi:hypothetical protein